MDTKNSQEIIDAFEYESERLAEGFKTGLFHEYIDDNQRALAIKHNCDCMGAGYVRIYWYMKRGQNRKPTICVSYMFPTYTKRKVCAGPYFTTRNIWACSEFRQLFDFSIEGLNTAIKYAEYLSRG